MLPMAPGDVERAQRRCSTPLVAAAVAAIGLVGSMALMPGGGSVFWFTMPVADGLASEAGAGEATRPPRWSAADDRPVRTR
ncbi:hypothetical protein [Pilimelia columellifera]|uniref:Uncharacterized protein n=1 Tax=Pilimelia columellifera subsp. columellifera TaxID=706583 RepID=A0ABN3N3S6_9ACTN